MVAIFLKLDSYPFPVTQKTQNQGNKHTQKNRAAHAKTAGCGDCQKRCKNKRESFECCAGAKKQDIGSAIEPGFT